VKIYFGEWDHYNKKFYSEFNYKTKKIKINSKDLPPDAQVFSLIGSYGGNDKNLREFLNFSGINAHDLWHDLKEKAFYINFHVGSVYGCTPEEIEFAFIKKYNPICESITQWGGNYVDSFYLRKSDIFAHYKILFKKFKKLKNYPKVNFYYEPSGYINKNNTLIQLGKKYKILYKILNTHLLLKDIKTNQLNLKKAISLPKIDIVEYKIDENLADILKTIDGSDSTDYSLLDIFLEFRDETLKPYQRNIIDQLPEEFYEYLQLPTCEIESYQTSKGILTMLSYRCAIDDYDVLLFLNGKLIEASAKYEYDPILGFIKKD